MILYIENDIYCGFDINDEQLLDILDDFCIVYEKDIIKEQKIDLDEFDVNTLFDNFFQPLKNIHLEYGDYGGEGCCFSLSIRQEN